MPIFDERCRGCNITEERVTEWDSPTGACPNCGASMERVITGGARYHPFPAGWWDNIAPNQSLYIRNKRDLREACDQHNTVSKFLEDS